MSHPRSLDEYLARFHANQRYEGYGFETAMVMPCPFCAAPGFMRARILEVEETMAEGATCSECGRSAKALFQKEPGVTRFEIVQTGGPDQLEWLTPKMRRLADGG